MGNGNEVAPNLIALMGWIEDAMPNAGDVVSFSYNHVAIVEEVHQDGTFKISEYNHNGDHKGPYGREITDGCPGCTFAKWPG
jgi:surface antigen